MCVSARAGAAPWSWVDLFVKSQINNKAAEPTRDFHSLKLFFFSERHGPRAHTRAQNVLWRHRQGGSFVDRDVCRVIQIHRDWVAFAKSFAWRGLCGSFDEFQCWRKTVKVFRAMIQNFISWTWFEFTKFNARHSDKTFSRPLADASSISGSPKLELKRKHLPKNQTYPQSKPKAFLHLLEAVLLLLPLHNEVKERKKPLRVLLKLHLRAHVCRHRALEGEKKL